MQRRNFLASLIAAAIPVKMPTREILRIHSNGYVGLNVRNPNRIFYATKFIGFANVKTPNPPSFELPKIHIYENIVD